MFGFNRQKETEKLVDHVVDGFDDGEYTSAEVVGTIKWVDRFNAQVDAQEADDDSDDDYTSYTLPATNQSGRRWF